MMRNDKTPVFYEVVVKCEITQYDVACLLSCGFEGGIGYWGRIVDHKKPEKLDVTLDDLSAMIYGERDEKHIYRHVDYPLNPGGEVHIQVTEDQHNTCHPKYIKVAEGGTVPEGYTHLDDGSCPEWYQRSGYDWTEDREGYVVCPVCNARARTVILTHDSLRKGLEIMRDKAPNQFEAIGTGRMDACTGDVFIQCCVFGTIVFG